LIASYDDRLDKAVNAEKNSAPISFGLLPCERWLCLPTEARGDTEKEYVVTWNIINEF